MKVTVIESFIDKKTGKRLNVGETIDVSHQRAKIMLNAKLVKNVLRTAQAAKTK